MAVLATLLGLLAYAAPPPARVYHQPGPLVRAAWIERLFPSDTLWVFPEARDLEALMARTKLDLPLRAEVRARAADRPTRDAFRHATSFFEVPPPPFAYVNIPNDLWDRLPASFLRASYLEHLRRGLGETSHFKFKAWPGSRPLMPWRLRRHATDAAAARRLADLAVSFRGYWRVPVVPATWRYLNSVAREAIVASLTDPAPEREGLNLSPPPPVPPFLSLRLGRFCVSEANCFNLAERLYDSSEASAGMTGFDGLDDLLAADYRELAAGETLTPGDLLVYRSPWLEDETLKPHHVAVCVAPGQVATKTGLSKFCPYVIEDLTVDHGRAGRTKPFTLTLYRHRDPEMFARACAGALR